MPEIRRANYFALTFSLNYRRHTNNNKTMKTLSAWLLASLICMTGFAQNSQRPIAIIPEPVSLKTSEGSFVLPDAVTLDAPNNKDLGQAIQFLTERITKAT